MTGLLWILPLGIAMGLVLAGLTGLAVDDPGLDFSRRPWWWVVVVALDVFSVVQFIGHGRWWSAALGSLLLLAATAGLVVTLTRKHGVRL